CVAADGSGFDADASLENHPSVLFDAVVIPDGEQAIAALAANGLALEFVRDQFRHGKTLLALGAGRLLLEHAGIPPDDEDEGLLLIDEVGKAAVQRFVTALAQHRHPARETDPPVV
ncbi:MAG: DJ-1/PfpI family protein, partial [Burkholderiales bacterium]|nr:DJ-1/PfpI family protein [Burkholderiales bacterium]